MAEPSARETKQTLFLLLHFFFMSKMISLDLIFQPYSHACEFEFENINNFIVNFDSPLYTVQSTQMRIQKKMLDFSFSPIWTSIFSLACTLWSVLRNIILCKCQDHKNFHNNLNSVSRFSSFSRVIALAPSLIVLSQNQQKINQIFKNAIVKMLRGHFCVFQHPGQTAKGLNIPNMFKSPNRKYLQKL